MSHILYGHFILGLTFVGKDQLRYAMLKSYHKAGFVLLCIFVYIEATVLCYKIKQIFMAIFANNVELVGDFYDLLKMYFNLDFFW